MQTQLANCCCENLRNVDSVRFDMANYNASTAAAIHAEGEATRKMLYENKIETLQNQINALQLQNAMCGVVKYPNSLTYNAGVSTRKCALWMQQHLSHFRLGILGSA